MLRTRSPRTLTDAQTDPLHTTAYSEVYFGDQRCLRQLDSLAKSVLTAVTHHKVAAPPRRYRSKGKGKVMVHTHETIERVAHGDDETIELHIGGVEFSRGEDRYAAIMISASARSRATASGSSDVSCSSSARTMASTSPHRRIRIAEASTASLKFRLNQDD